LKILLELATLFRRGVTVKGGKPSLALGAEFMVRAIGSVFPQHRVPDRQLAAAAAQVVAWWERKAERRAGGVIAELDPELVVVAAFEAIGVNGQDVHNWLKGV
jgi:hypothetical protein